MAFVENERIRTSTMIYDGDRRDIRIQVERLSVGLFCNGKVWLVCCGMVLSIMHNDGEQERENQDQSVT